MSAIVNANSAKAEVETTPSSIHVGPGIKTSVDIEFWDPILKPRYSDKGIRLQNPKVVGWEPRNEMVDITVSDETLREKGYEYRNGDGVPLKPATPNQMPWEELWFGLCTILCIGLIVWFAVEIVRRLRAPLPQPAAAPVAPIVHHNYYAAAPRTTPNIPSYTSAHINTMLDKLKEKDGSGRMFYQNTDETLYLETDPAVNPTPATPPREDKQ